MIILVEFTCYFFPNITRENGNTDFGQAIMIYPMAHIKCHKSSLCGSLRSPPEGTITGVLTGSFGLHFPWPRAWDWSPAQVSVIITDYLASAFLTLVAKSCFAIANISERFPLYYLDCLFSSDRLLPALLTPPAFWIFSLSAACPDLLLWHCLWICLAYVDLDTVVWTLPVWPRLCLIKAANGSQHHWPLITEDFARNRSSSFLSFHYGGICSSIGSGFTSTTA